MADRPVPDVLQDLALPPEVVEIAERLEQAGWETWAVGGALRDRLLKEERVGDVDLATAAPPDEVQRLFRRTIPVGIAFGTVGVLDAAGGLHEVTTFRHDVETDGRHAVVRFGASLDEDLARRDFTINALAYHPGRKEWRDPFGGHADLLKGVVRAVGDPATRFREDYLRILRGIRFAARFGFTIDHATWTAAVQASEGLALLSAERVRDEWFKSLRTAQSLGDLCAKWREAGAADRWLPGLAGSWPAAATNPQPRDPVLLTVLLCAQPAEVLRGLRASNAEIARADAAAGAPPAPDGTDETSVRRWMRAAGPAVEDLVTLETWRSDASPPWRPVVERIVARGDAVHRRDLAVSGDDLLAEGVPPGPAVGEALDRLLDAVISDPGLNTREALLRLAREAR